MLGVWNSCGAAFTGGAPSVTRGESRPRPANSTWSPPSAPEAAHARFPGLPFWLLTLFSFLRDPSAATTKIVAKEEYRIHLDNKIGSRQLDVATGVERTGRPYSLVLSKTQDSYERSLRRYHEDQKLLESLPG